MNRFKLALGMTLIAASTLALADEMSAGTTREQRMDGALQNYRGARNDPPGPAARAEESIKRGTHRAGHAIHHGAVATGHAIKRGIHKTGHTLHRAGEKIEDSKAAKPS